MNVGSPLVSSPLLHNGILVAATYDSWIKDAPFTGKNFVLGMNTEDGKQIWGYEIPGDVFSSPCLVDDAIIVVGSMNNDIYALEGYSGNVRWKFETGGEVWSSPSYNGSEIFIGSWSVKFVMPCRNKDRTHRCGNNKLHTFYQIFYNLHKILPFPSKFKGSRICKVPSSLHLESLRSGEEEKKRPNLPNP